MAHETLTQTSVSSLGAQSLGGGSLGGGRRCRRSHGRVGIVAYDRGTVAGDGVLSLSNLVAEGHIGGALEEVDLKELTSKHLVYMSIITCTLFRTPNSVCPHGECKAEEVPEHPHVHCW